VKAQKIAEFLTAHCWLKRTVAAKWFPQFRLPNQQPEAGYYELPANEPPRGRQSKDAYHALKKEYGLQIPKKYSLQQLADNLQKSGHGVHSRESVARALGKKK
jgi:hypothetical protein